jgi:hypothetical protein
MAEPNPATPSWRSLVAGAPAFRPKTSGRKRLNHPLVAELTLLYERLTADGDHRLLTYMPEPGSPTASA